MQYTYIVYIISMLTVVAFDKKSSRLKSSKVVKVFSGDTEGSLSRTESLIMSFTQVAVVAGLGAFFIGAPLNRVVDMQTKFEAQQSDLVKTVSSIQTQQTKFDDKQTKFEAQLSDLGNSVSYIDLKFNSVGIATGAVVGLLAGSGNVVKILEYVDKKEDDKRKKTKNVEKE